MTKVKPYTSRSPARAPAAEKAVGGRSDSEPSAATGGDKGHGDSQHSECDDAAVFD